METVCLDAIKSNMCGASVGSGGKGMSRTCMISAVCSCSEAGASEFGASEGMAKEGALI